MAIPHGVHKSFSRPFGNYRASRSIHVEEDRDRSFVVEDTLTFETHKGDLRGYE